MDIETRRAEVRGEVRAAMAARGWNNAELAEAADVDPKTVNDFIAGRRWPQAKTLNAIEKAFGWDLDQINRMVERLGTYSARLVEFPKTSVPAPSDEVAALETGYERVVEFTEHVRRNYPTLTAQALDLLLAGTALYRDALSLRLEADPEAKANEMADRILLRHGGDVDRAVFDPEWGDVMRDTDLMKRVVDLLQSARERSIRRNLSEPSGKPEDFPAAAATENLEEPGEF